MPVDTIHAALSEEVVDDFSIGGIPADEQNFFLFSLHCRGCYWVRAGVVIQNTRYLSTPNEISLFLSHACKPIRPMWRITFLEPREIEFREDHVIDSPGPMTRFEENVDHSILVGGQ